MNRPYIYMVNKDAAVTILVLCILSASRSGVGSASFHGPDS